MTKPASLGEFEQLLLLAVLRLDADAYGLDIARELEARAGRTISRGALYTSLDRLEDKGLLRWKTAAGASARNGLPRRLYTVTPAGIAALSASRETLRRMWRGIDHLLKEPTS
jgi:PadR family transcriptional regulator PadR